MTTQSQNDEQVIELESLLLPQGHVLGVPYDLRRPASASYRARMWSRDDPRIFPPKALGAGRTVNFYWVIHSATYAKRRRTEARKVLGGQKGDAA